MKMKVIILYDGNEESAAKCDLEAFLEEKGIIYESGDVGYYSD